MSRDDLAIGAIWAVAVGLAAWAAYEVYNLARALLPALLAGLFTVMVAILTHVTTQIRERAKREQELKQSNYKDLLDLTAKFVTTRDREDFDRAHLYSWVVGSEEVVRATQLFVTNVDVPSLNSLVRRMREDIGLRRIADDLQPQVFLETTRMVLQPGIRQAPVSEMTAP